MKILGRILPLCLAAIGVAGCAPDGLEGDESVDDGEAQALQAPTSQTTLRNPDGVYFADVTANGTGCPAGTWQTSLSPDGQTFTTTFSAYETMVDPQTMISIKDCYLAIKLHTPQGLSFSVTNFYYAGYALLEQGITGRQFASYYFQGNPVQQAQVRTDLSGPYDSSYLFTDEVPITDTVWSPCGTTRDLNVVTRLRLQNSNPRRNGYMNLSAIDGSAKLVVKLAWRECTTPPAAPVDAGARDAGAADAGRDSGRRVR
ncbi:MAG: DUF4360 domain-containing protein [Polyangiales bacterium]